ncbi:hypothetical protein FH5T_02135 [Draconibacterium orientale]|uniref:Uncharacterized protein n=1 Tax=Draconibacterium orientale TaxID=1168034 RepID=A0ABM5QD11_9BACT|nr:hypothetical protein FH5T_02135 [Draconibacterium orientale]
MIVFLRITKVVFERLFNFFVFVISVWLIERFIFCLIKLEQMFTKVNAGNYVIQHSYRCRILIASD